MAPLKHLNIEFKDKGAANHVTLMGCLQPHCRLSTISIEGYKGLELPKWAESLTTSLPYLVRIHLEYFDCLKILPSLSQLCHLKYLMLKEISKVEFMQSDGVGIPLDDRLVFFPSLEELELDDLPKLKGWWREETNTVTRQAYGSSLTVPSFPRLRKLVLRDCPNLTAVPSCPKLISMILSECHEALTLLGSKTIMFCNPNISCVLYMKELTIDKVEALDSLFGESLGGIQQLTVQFFEGESLPSLPVEAVVKLNIHKLEIRFCRNLKSLSGFVEHLTCLQSLSIVNCPNLELENNGEGVTMTPWNALYSLSSLTLYGLPKLINLPKAIQYLTSLEYLRIAQCEMLEALPEWLNCLKSMQTLDLRDGCENLKKRCRKPDGEDWSKVHHIPHILLERKRHSRAV